MNPEFDIIIPHFGLTDELTALCRHCLRSIEACSQNYRLIFVDNGSPQFDLIAPLVRCHPHLLVRGVINGGFIEAVNHGIWLSTAPYVVLMNNDTQAVPGWLEKLREPLLTDGIGLCGPVTTTPRSWQGRQPPGAGWQILNRGAMLAFFCVMIRRAVFDQIGVLESSYGVGLGDDDEFCRRAQKRGWQLALVRDLVIPHNHRSTFHTLYKPEEVKVMQERALTHYHATA